MCTCTLPTMFHTLNTILFTFSTFLTQIAVEHEVALRDMLGTDFLTRVVQSEAVRRHNV